MRFTARTPRPLTTVVLLIATTTACVDKDVLNPNALDAQHALTAGNVEKLIARAYGRWLTVHGYSGPTLALSIMGGEHSSPWAASGMELWGRIPRQPTKNVAGAYGLYLSDAWDRSYDAIANLRIGLSAIDSGVTLGEEGDRRARAYGKFMQGLAHGTVALLYDSGYVWDETRAMEDVTLEGYPAVMEAALGYLDQAIGLSEGGTFTLPADWMSHEVTAQTLAQLAHSWKARFRANVARTPAERRAVDWDAVAADVAAGIAADWDLAARCDFVDPSSFCDEGLNYRLYPSWSMQNNWIAGMADQSGAYQAWIRAGVYDKLPFLIITPDTRWPQGPDETTQLEHPGEYFVVNRDDDGSRIWARPDRGTWRWSYYDQHPTWLDVADLWTADELSLPQVTVREMRALVAEAAYYRGDFASVASFVNETRTLHGLRATNADGANPDCVPRLPSGACGDLWEMFKWEKRLETQFMGPLRVGWYFDSRGWGDLIEGTILQFPVPYSEMEVLGREPYDYGGVGGAWGAAPDSYGYFTQTSAVASVVIEPDSAVLAIGSTLRLAATALDAGGDPMTGRSFVWSSSDTSVATVDTSGLVTAVAEGEAIIKAFTEWAEGLAGITVVIPPPTVHSVVVTPDTVTLTSQGETAQLTATAFDSTSAEIVHTAFSWSSSDESIATVDGIGVVTAEASGVVTITATAGDFSDSATVTVRIPPLVVVSPQSISLEGIGTSYTLSAEAWSDGTQLPAPAFTWSSLNPSIATVDDGGTVTVVAAGQVTIAADVDGGVGYALLTVSVPGVSPVTAWYADSVASHDYAAVWGSSDTNIFVVGYHSEILRCDGTSWSPMTSWRNSLSGVWGTGPVEAFAVGSRWQYRHDGVDWIDMNGGSGPGVDRVWGTSPVDVFGVGGYGVVARYDGDAWQTLIQSTGVYENSLEGVWGTSPNNVFAVGIGGTILHFDGANWTPQNSATNSDLNAVWGTSPQNVYAVGRDGALVHYDGTQWSKLASGTSASLSGVWGTSPTDIFAVGDEGTVRHFDGTSWTSLSVGTTETLSGIWGTSSGTVFIVGTGGTILRGERE